jgi:hypothetical protein
VENGLNLDYVDLAVFDCLKDFCNSPSCRKMQEGAKHYYTMPYRMIIEDLPLSGLTKTDSVYRRFKKLELAGLLELHPENRLMKQVWFAWGRNYDKIIGDRKTKGKAGSKEVSTDQNPVQYGSKSGLSTDENPPSNTTNPYTTTKGLADKNPPAEKDTLWPMLIASFEAHHKQHFSPSGQWSGFRWTQKECKHLKELRRTLTKRVEDRTKQPATDDAVLRSFDAFLTAVENTDDWFVRNAFTPSGLNSQFQNILNKISAPPAASKTPQPESEDRYANVPNYGH